jgi:hypothetical protein
MDRFPDSNVGATTTIITRHGVINIIVRWFWVALEQRSRGHKLSCLTVTALCDILVNPDLL